MRKMVVVFGAFCLVLCNYCAVIGVSQSSCCVVRSVDLIDEYICNEMQSKHIPGLSAAVVVGDEVVWQNCYGYANIEENRIVSNQTLFKIASVSKTLTATCLMQLYEEGYLDIYDSINDYLPFTVVHPLFPSVDITFHMLLTHSSGICDNWEYLFNFVGDAPISFQVFLEEYLVAGGLYYDGADNFCSWEPGSSWRYTNVGVALIGYLVERISGENFSTYTETHLFGPLDMSDSGWYLRDLNDSDIAMPYHWNGSGYEAYGHIGWVDVPAGDLRTSAAQLVNFLMMFVNNGSFNSEELLSSAMVSLMLTPQLPFNQNLGLIWWKSMIGGRHVWGHGGVDFGARAQMHFDPESDIGVVVLINGEANILPIVHALFDFAQNQYNNGSPASPKIVGPVRGKPFVEYVFWVNSTDPDDDAVMYCIDWGDGVMDTTEYGASGEGISVSHSWKKKGTFEVKVKAIDSNGADSEWTDLVVSMPKHMIYVFGLFESLVECFHNVCLCFRYLLFRGIVW